MKIFAKINPFLVVILIALTTAGFMIYASLNESAISEEPGNIAAGYACLKLKICDLNPQLSSLNQIIIGLPLIFTRINFNPELPHNVDLTVSGQTLLYKSGNNADLIINQSRLITIILSALLLLFIYYWSKEFLGRFWALLPSLMLALSPNFLAYGHYATADIIKTLTVSLTLYCLLKYLSQPSTKKLIFAGLTLGITQLIFSSSGAAAILILTLFMAVFVFYLIQSGGFGSNRPKTLTQKIGRGALVFLSLLALSAVFVFIFYLLLPTSHYSFADQIALAGRKTLSEYHNDFKILNARSVQNQPVYFQNKVWTEPPHYYLPLIFILKEPLPILLLLGSALILGFKNFSAKIKKNSFIDYLKINFEEFTLIIFIMLYLIYLIFLLPNPEGFRNLLPLMPLFYLLALSILKNWHFKQKTVIVAGLIFWLGLESVTTFPHHLAYFNLFAGGRDNGHLTAIQSNYDWGQDLKYLAEFVKENQINKIAVDYYGGGDPIYYLGDKAVPWSSKQFLPQESEIEWLAISATKLRYARAAISLPLLRQPEEEYRWLEKIDNPFGRAGKTIFIYKLNPPLND